jgi:hypothetical protein
MEETSTWVVASETVKPSLLLPTGSSPLDSLEAQAAPTARCAFEGPVKITMIGHSMAGPETRSLSTCLG